MEFKDRFIAAQNAASVAASLLASGGDLAELPESAALALFERTRTSIFEGTLKLALQSQEDAGAQIIEGHFPGTTTEPATQTSTVPSAPQGNGQTTAGPAPAQSYPPPAPAPVPPAPPTGAVCPKCGGEMWDNRASKKNPKAPDFRCKDAGCDGVRWPAR